MAFINNSNDTSAAKATEDSKQALWLHKYSLKPRIVILIACLWSIAGVASLHTKLGDYLEAKLSAPVNFKVRHYLGQTPKQNSKLKIFAIDDQAFAWLGSPAPDLKLWGDILDGIAESKPRLIIVDAMFSARPTDSGKEIQFYFSRLQKLGVPVVLGSFLSLKPLAFKTTLDLDHDWYSLDRYLPGLDVAVEGRGRLSHVPSWIVRETWHAYGPAAELRPWFPKVGHFQLLQEHKVEPFFRLSQQRVLPHISMFAAEQIQFINGNLKIDGVRVALDRNGSVDVNFIPTAQWKIRSLLEPMKAVQSGYAVSQIEEGDVVLILPLYFTGNTDFRPSPFGMVPGGLYLAAMLNSVLSKNWLQPILAGEILTLMSILLIAVVAIPSSVGIFWMIVSGISLTIFIASQVFFSYFGFVIPWLIPIGSTLLAGIQIFIAKTRAHERKVLMLRSALEGAVSSTQLDGLLRSPDAIHLEPKERVVTLMFVDVVGFSISAENLLPRLAFENLKRILGDISTIVHSHGGIVDKSLGDGLLCYFGYRFDSDQTTPDHAEQALKCAIQIQIHSTATNLTALHAGQMLHPLRIGLNTASCYLGDIGSQNRIEFTVVGNGVNFAKRLEGACDMFSVMMGATTWELVRSMDISETAVNRRYIRIKHHQELVDAFEYDPLVQKPELRAEMTDAFRKAANLQRLSQRIFVHDPEALRLTTDFGPGILLNFSGGGISAQLATPLARGNRVTISIDSRDSKLQPILREMGMSSIEVEVRWQYQASTGYVHGLSFKNLTETQADTLSKLLSNFAFMGTPGDMNRGDLEPFAS